MSGVDATSPILLGLGLGSVGIGTLVASTRWVVRRADRSLPRARLTAALVVAPTALLGVVVVLFAAGAVAFVADDSLEGFLSGAAVAGLAAAASGILVAVHLIVCAIAHAVTHPTPRVRTVGRVALCLVAAYLTFLWIGLAWLPAIVLAFRMRQPPLPGATVGPRASQA